MAGLSSPQNPSLITTALIVVSVVFPMISLYAIFLRNKARRQSGQPLHADDYWIAASWVLTLALSILVWGYAGKAGVNYYRISFLDGTEASLEVCEQIRRSLYRSLADDYPVAFPITTAKLRLDSTALGLAQVSSSFTLDLIVLCLPLPVISRLNMKAKRKTAIILIFWLGAFCVVAAIVRTVLLDQSIRQVVSSTDHDHVANQSKQYIFMVLEPNCSILAACLPTYAPLMTGGRDPGNNSGPGVQLPGDSNAAESQVELQGLENWPGKSRREVLISSSRFSDDTPPVAINQMGISVTNGVSVYRD
ncbi:hypothetical protein SLS53_008181 [Cytospora paraplurivora]|uniref:Rhodopsin domain-containing protein n=1 Tax=Cytospora paraplurivora TaxID=2898453 RepID=A0AAN9TYH0_9PEZI